MGISGLYLTLAFCNSEVPTFRGESQLGTLLKQMTALPQVTDSVGLGWAQESVFFNKLPGDVDAAGPELTPGEPLL